MTEDEGLKAKDVEHYAALVNAWLNTRLELDKSLLTLSAGGIGVLVTLLSTVRVTTSWGQFLSMLALGFFAISLVSVLFVLKRNSTHIEKVISRQEKRSLLLEFLDRLALFSFLAAMVISAALGICIAANASTP